jgi:hypothetical protein
LNYRVKFYFNNQESIAVFVFWGFFLLKAKSTGRQGGTAIWQDVATEQNVAMFLLHVSNFQINTQK